MKALLILIYAYSSPYLLLYPSARTYSLAASNVGNVKYLDEFILNPACLGEVGKLTASASYTKWYYDVKYLNGVFAYRWKVSPNVFGAGISYLDYGRLEKYDQNGEYIGEFNSSVTLFTFSYGRSVAENFFMGINWKYFVDRIEKDVATGWALDIGSMLYTPYNIWINQPYLIPFSVGIALNNLGSFGGYQFPTIMRIGFAWQTFVLAFQPQEKRKPYSYLTLSFGIPFYGEKWLFSIGHELNINNLLLLRVGYERAFGDNVLMNGKGGNFSANLNRFGLGMGFIFKEDVHFDYTYRIDYWGDTHHLAVNIEF